MAARPEHTRAPRMPKKGPGTYDEKRDPELTNEPFGEAATEGAQTLVGAFVVHLHDATRSHYDLRVEANGVLASFAVPRGPSLDPETKRFAVHTEDHPLEYLEFEDVIPEGQYGGGPMIVWDRGTVRYLEGPSERGIPDGKLDMMLSGRKLRGRYALVKLKNEPKGWLLIKKKDPYAIVGVAADEDIVRLERSVLSGLTVSELERREAIGEALVASAKKRLGAAKRKSPEPMTTFPFATYVERDALPEGDGHTFEIELDGLPARVTKAGEQVTLVERNEPTRRDLALFYPEIVRAVRALAPNEIVLEGTVVTFDNTGAPSVAKLAARARTVAKGDIHLAQLEAPVTFVADDLLAIGDEPVHRLAFDERRALLDETVKGEGVIRTSPLLPGPASVARKIATDLGVRRVLAKRNDAPYVVAPSAHKGTTTAADAARGEVYDHVRVTIGDHAELTRVEHGSTKAALREVRITNPSKIYFPERGYEKARVVGYYRSVANVLLPHVRGRPVTVVRYPDGVHGKNFFQWNVPPQMPAWMRTVAFKDEESERTKRGFMLDDLESLTYVINLGTLPIHVFSCKAESLAQCDYVAIDFDVKLASLDAAIVLAHTLNELLGSIGMTGFAKTSGQTGLHVLVPLGPGHGYPTARAMVELLGRLLVQAHPELATMERVAGRRGAKVYVDTGQTGPTRTLVAAYSLRAVADATVSYPLAWSDVKKGLDPAAFTLETVPELVKNRVCPMASFDEVVPDVARAVAKLGERFARS